MTVAVKLLPVKKHPKRLEVCVQVWDKIIDENGAPQFMLAFAPLSIDPDPSSTAPPSPAKQAFDRIISFNHMSLKGLGNGICKGVYLFRPLAADVCEVTLCYHVQYRGVPETIVESRLRDAMDIVDDMQTKFVRNWYDVDQEMLEEFSEGVTNNKYCDVFQLDSILSSLDAIDNAHPDNASSSSRRKTVSRSHANRVKGRLATSVGSTAKSPDDSLRSEFPNTPEGNVAHEKALLDAKDDLKMAMEEFKDLLKSRSSRRWRPVASTSPFVESHMAVVTRKYMLGRGCVKVDRSPQDIVAYLFLMEAQHRMDKFHEDGHKDRRVYRLGQFNDQLVCTTYKRPSRLWPMIHTNSRMNWAPCPLKAGDFIIAVQSVRTIPDNLALVDIDPSKTRLINVTELIHIQYEQHSEADDGDVQQSTVTQFTLLQIPKQGYMYRSMERFMRRNVMKFHMRQLSNLRDDFRDDAHIDIDAMVQFIDERHEEDEERLSSGRIARSAAAGFKAVVTEEEDSAAMKVMAEFEAIKDDEWEELLSPDFLVKQARGVQQATQHACYRSSSVLDSPIEECLFEQYCKDSRGNIDDAFNNVHHHDCIQIRLKKINHHSQYYDVIFWFNHKAYRFVDRVICEKIAEASYAVFYENIEDENLLQKLIEETETDGWKIYTNHTIDSVDEYTDPKSLKAGVVQLLHHYSVVKYEKLEELFDIPQTKVTYYTEVFASSGEKLNPIICEDIAMQRLSKIISSRKRLDKGVEITKASHAECKKDIMHHLVFEDDDVVDDVVDDVDAGGERPEYEEEEKMAISVGLYMDQLFDECNKSRAHVQGHDADNEFGIIKSHQLAEAAEESSDTPNAPGSGRLSGGSKKTLSRKQLMNRRKVGAFQTYAGGSSSKNSASGFDLDLTMHRLKVEEATKKILGDGFRGWARSKALVNAECLQVRKPERS